MARAGRCPGCGGAPPARYVHRKKLLQYGELNSERNESMMAIIERMQIPVGVIEDTDRSSAAEMPRPH